MYKLHTCTFFFLESVKLNVFKTAVGYPLPFASQQEARVFSYLLSFHRCFVSFQLKCLNLIAVH